MSDLAPESASCHTASGLVRHRLSGVDFAFWERELQRFHVGDHIGDLIRLYHIFERRHQRVAILDPGPQRFIRYFTVVDGKSSALGQALQARADLLGVAVREVTDRAFLVEDVLTFCG